MEALKKPSVQFLILLLVGCGVTGAIFLQKQSKGTQEVTAPPSPPPAGMGQKVVEQVPTQRGEVQRATVKDGDMVELNFPKERPRPPDPIKSVVVSEKKKDEGPRELPSMVHMEVEVEEPPLEFEAPRIFGPRGLLIKAALVLTVDSSSLDTPVLAMVTEDVFWNGNILVPAGTQVFSKASEGKTRDRIEVKGTYTFVWADGREYKINGIALDHDTLDDESFSVTDGSAGIRGEILKTDEYAELKLLVGEMVSGLAANSQETFQSVLGPVPDNTASNSAFAGISSAGDRYAELMLSRIESDLTYVRVAAGQTFYIFTEDVFEPGLASVAGELQGNEAKSSFQLQQEAYLERIAAEQAKYNAGSADSRAAPAEELRRQQFAADRDAYLERVTTLIQTKPEPTPPLK